MNFVIIFMTTPFSVPLVEQRQHGGFASRQQPNERSSSTIHTLSTRLVEYRSSVVLFTRVGVRVLRIRE